jgi:hypothetical protein
MFVPASYDDLPGQFSIWQFRLTDNEFIKYPEKKERMMTDIMTAKYFPKERILLKMEKYKK